jgi:glycosyltransferase involved in cell wall biosynthesis
MSKSMRILHVMEKDIAVQGGRESHLSRFCLLSNAEGHENAFLADDAPLLRSSDELVVALQQDGADQSTLSGVPDAILLHSRDSWARAAEMSQLAPTFAWVHDFAFVCPASIAYFRNTREACNLPPGLHCMANAYLKFCNARRPDRNLQNYLHVRRSMAGLPHLSGVIVASQFMKQRLTIAGVPHERISIVPYFLANERFDIPLDHSQENPNRILYVGRLAEVKGVDVLLDALALLPKQYELFIAGDGYNKPLLQQQIQKLGLAEKRVIFGGYIKSEKIMGEIYASAAVVAVPSLWPEPFGIIGLEAASHGKAVVASDVGGIHGWLVDQQTGLLVKPDDANDLAAKLLMLLESSDLRHEMGRKGHKHVRQEFSWKSHWDRFTEIVEVCGVQQ